MSVKGGRFLTLADHAKRMDPDGSVAVIVEMLSETNAILDDLITRECNDGTSHKTTMRTGIPEAAWRMLNYGVPKGKSDTAQVTDTTGMLEAYNEVDKALADLNGNTAQFRLSEANARIEGMGQQMAETLFYGDTTKNPERFLGLSARYSTLDKSKAESANTVIDAGGQGIDNTSIWLVTWGENTTHGLFPKGSKAGLDHMDKGQETLTDEKGGMYEGYRDHFKWDLGLTVRDHRYNGRICNLDVAQLNDSANVATLKKVIRWLIELSEQVEEGGNKVFYTRNTVKPRIFTGVIFLLEPACKSQD